MVESVIKSAIEVVTSSDPSNRFSIASSRFVVKEEVKQAILAGQPVVALESTIITHGMDYPMNRDTALAVEQIVRDNGAIPATIAIVKGVVKIGLEKDDIELLSSEGRLSSRKCSRRDLAYVLAKNGNGSTTVAATMYLASLAGIKIFVTGGIGGVHRGAESTFDISADLTELARTPVAVICAGVKSILDIPKTLEFLETMGVPVVSYGTDWFPDFFTSNSGIKTVFRADSADECASIIQGNDILKLKNGIIFAVPVPADKEANQDNIQKAIASALAEADQGGIKGAEITPFLLKRVNQLTGGESAASNVELIKNNAKLGSQIAVALSSIPDISKTLKYEKLYSKPTPITIIGGAALDILSMSHSLHIDSGSSHIGKITIQEGGSARNVAECVARLLGNQNVQENLKFITAVGDDEKAEILVKGLSKLGLDTDSIQVKKGERTACFNGIINGQGDFLAGIADMDILSEISKEHLNMQQFSKSSILLLDSNIAKETLSYILDNAIDISQIIYEPISCEKSSRILHENLLSKITMLKPNLIQLNDIYSVICKNQAQNQTEVYQPININRYSKILDKDSRLNEISKDVVQMSSAIFDFAIKNSQSNSSRLQRIITTLGSEGVMIVNQDLSHKYYSPLDLDTKLIKSAVGSGDSFMGGFIYGLYKGQDIDQCVEWGQKCAVLSLQSQTNVSDKIRKEILQ
eukprot:403343364